MFDQQVWISEKEVAKITGLSVSTLQKQRFSRRGIPYCKIGRSVRYAEKDVIKFMEARKITFTRNGEYDDRIFL